MKSLVLGGVNAAAFVRCACFLAYLTNVAAVVVDRAPHPSTPRDQVPPRPTARIRVKPTTVRRSARGGAPVVGGRLKLAPQPAPPPQAPAPALAGAGRGSDTPD
jgi:hypothetical protein